MYITYLHTCVNLYVTLFQMTKVCFVSTLTLELLMASHFKYSSLSGKKRYVFGYNCLSMYYYYMYVELVITHVMNHKVFGSEGEPIDQARIIALRPQVDSQLHSEMQVFLKRVATDCDLMNFYQTYVKCCEHVLERQSTFKLIKVSSPLCVCVFASIV